jgi:hypothetical protein
LVVAVSSIPDSFRMLPLTSAGPVVTAASRVRFHPYFARQEGDEYVVGHAEASVYLAVPPVGVQVMELLDQGLPVGEVASRLVDDDGVAPDVVDFIEGLIDYELVAEVDGRPVTQASSPAAAEGVALFRRLRPGYVRWLVSPPALVVHAAAAAAAVLLLLRHPEHVPGPSDLFVYPWYTVNTLLVCVILWGFSLVHELGHVVAARARGLQGRISLGRRLYDVVFQCNLADIWRVPRAQRIVIFLAGIIVNVWIFLALLVVLIWQGPTLPPLWVGWLKLAAFAQWFGILWQFNLYLQTDLYYVLADLFRAKRLMEDARVYVRHVAAKVVPRLSAGDLGHLPRRERRFVQAYAVLYAGGVLLATVVFVAYGLPFLIISSVGAIRVLAQGSSAGLPRLADAVVMLTVYAASFGLLGWTWWRERRTRAAPPARV